MALPSNYRWIAVGKLAIRNRKNAPHYAPSFKIEDLIAAFKDRIQSNTAHRNYARDSKLMWCTDFDEDSEYVRMLLQVGDKNVSGVSYLHFRTLQTRDISKDEDEGGHYTSHIIVRKKPDQSGRYLTLVEKVPGVFLSSVKDHFSWVTKDKKYEKPVTDDDGKPQSFRPVFDMDGHQSKTIKEALSTGVLQDVELVGHEEMHVDGLDEDPIIKEIIHEARWEIKKNVSIEEARTLFQKIGEKIPGFKDQYDHSQLFVRIKTENGQIKRTEVEHNGEEILEQAFVQNELVSGFESPLEQRSEGIRGDMIEKMIVLAQSIEE